jgi:hypothetical protein
MINLDTDVEDDDNEQDENIRAATKRKGVLAK